jgi:hypothetical protein
VGILLGQLESSLMGEVSVGLDSAISEHRELMRRRERMDAADPSGTIVARRIARVSKPPFLGDEVAHSTERWLRSPVPSRG